MPPAPGSPALSVPAIIEPPSSSASVGAGALDRCDSRASSSTGRSLPAVIAILIVLVGIVAYPSLPVAQYPEIAPPTISITASYPGASAEVLAETVAAPLEQEINGVEDMIYMTSSSTGDGRVTLDTSSSSSAPISTTPRSWCRTGWRRPSRACPIPFASWA